MKFDRKAFLERLSVSRPGYRLLDVIECGIPMFLVKATVLVVERKPLGPLEEYVLKSISQGFAVVPEIAGILGVSTDLVTSILVELQKEDLVKQVVVHGHREMSLTMHGSAVLDSHYREAPSRQQIRIGFDRLRWDVTAAAQGHLLKPIELQEQGRLELRPKTKQRVRDSDLSLESIDREVQALGSKGVKPLLLAVASIDRTNRMFLPAELAIFESLDGGESQFAVIIDGRPSEAHETALMQLGGLGFLDIEIGDPAPPPISSLKQDYSERNFEIIVADAPSSEVREQERLARIAAAFESQESELPENVKPMIHNTTGVNTSQVEFIDTFEHQLYLTRALTETKERLVIFSPWISAQVVNKGFLEQLRQLLQRGVRVHIGYGLNQRPGDRKTSFEDEKAEEHLKKMAERFSNFTFVRLGNTHSKQLLFDETHISGSFNWLSFQGSRHKQYRHEESTVIRKKRIVDAKYIDLCGRIEGAARSQW